MRWLAVLLLLGCSDLTHNPNPLLPAIQDARLRVTRGISDIAVRQQLILALSDLEIALQSDKDPATAVATVVDLLDRYPVPSDAPDVNVIRFTVTR